MGIGSNELVPAVSFSSLSVINSVKGTVLSISSALSEGPPAPDTWRRPIWVQTAVMIKKLIVTAIKSMNGTRLMVVSSGFTNVLELVSIGDDQVEDRDRRLIDVID